MLNDFGAGDWQPADQQISRMDAPHECEICKWTPQEVVAGDDGSFGCFKTTITIDRRSEDGLWVEEPLNRTHVMCAKSDNKVRKPTIESSPGRKRTLECNRRTNV